MNDSGSLASGELNATALDLLVGEVSGDDADDGGADADDGGANDGGADADGDGGGRRTRARRQGENRNGGRRRTGIG